MCATYLALSLEYWPTEHQQQIRDGSGLLLKLISPHQALIGIDHGHKRPFPTSSLVRENTNTVIDQTLIQAEP